MSTIQIQYKTLTTHAQPGNEDDSTSPSGSEPGGDAMMVDECEPEDPATLNDDFQPPADFRNRKSHLMAVLQHRQQPLGKLKAGSA